MRPGPAIIRICPHCASRFAQKSYASRNTFGARYWTDGKMDAPMYPKSPDIVRCPHCKSVLWLSKSVEVEGDDPLGTNVPHYELVCDGDLEALLENSEGLPSAEVKQIRWKLWHLGNDPYRVKTQQVAPDYSKAQRENMAALFGILSEDNSSERLAKAEIARELGWFDEAGALLSRDFDTKLLTAAGRLRGLVKKRLTALALLS